MKLDETLSIRLEQFIERYHELEALLGDPEVIAENEKFTQLSKEYAQLEALVLCYNNIKSCQAAVEAATEMLNENDPELKAMAKEEIAENESQMKLLLKELQLLLLPKDPDDERNIYLEIRAGTGGDEAAIFVGDLHRMYSRYAENVGWQLEIISASPSEMGGYKEIISRISGKNVYARLKFESGAHRVQRVPETESQGRVHTSACTVAILSEVESVEHIDIKSDELRIDTFRASGAGGQHVNKTDSAIRITHLPSGIVVECQDERSQHKNKSKALTLLQSKLLSEEQSKQRHEEEQTRRTLVGSGDRSERIRTYNYPQNRITDHRINLTLYKLEEVMEGALEPILGPLRQYDQTEQLSSLGLNLDDAQ